MLSIIIPARKEEKAIGATVSRLASLQMLHEIIVSDDSSADRTSEVARAAGARVVSFTGERHAPGRTRNAGAREAEGELVAFVDGDVVIPEPELFFKRACMHFNDPQVAGVCGPQRALPEVETWADRISFGILNATLRFQNNLLHHGEASGKFMLVRKSAFDAINGFREDLITREDGDFFARLSKIGTTIFDPSLMVYHGARRAHKVGWARLWYTWLSNSVYFALFNKSLADDWTPVR